MKYFDDYKPNLSYKEKLIKSIDNIYDALFSINVITSEENLNNFKGLTETLIDCAENWYQDIQEDNRKKLVEELMNEQSRRFGMIDRSKENYNRGW